METPTTSFAAALGASVTSISELLNFPGGSADLLDDVDFESTMMMFDHPESAGTPHHGSSSRRLSVDPLDFTLTNLVDLFAHNDADMDTSSSMKDEPLPLPASYLSPDMKLRINGRISFTSGQHPVACGSGGPTIKHEPGAMAGVPELSPVMDSFLRESWEDIVEGAARSARSSWKMLQSPPTIIVPSTNASSGQATPSSHSFILPSPTAVVGLPPPPVLKAARSASKKKQTAASTISSTASASQPAASKQSASKSSRRAKQCVSEGCDRRAQSNNRCKTHGGGARCQMQGCDKSSQGGGLCRAHGGGKKCRVPGCTKGTQRLGLCYLHGGIRRCITEGCKKKDRGNGYCISHGGGRRCEITACDRSVRKGNRCQTHQVGGDESPFQITRGQGLAFP